MSNDIANDKIRQYTAQRIRQFRLAKGISQEDLAKMVGYESFQAVALLERGERAIKTEILSKIAAALEVSIDEFFPNQKTGENSTLSIKLRASKVDHEVEKSLMDFAKLAKKKFSSKD